MFVIYNKFLKQIYRKIHMTATKISWQKLKKKSRQKLRLKNKYKNIIKSFLSTSLKKSGVYFTNTNYVSIHDIISKVNQNLTLILKLQKNNSKFYNSKLPKKY